jgi:hypothetical protein
MKLYNKDTGNAQSLEEIKKEFQELQHNTNEFNKFTFEGFLRKYYNKRMK